MTILALVIRHVTDLENLRSQIAVACPSRLPAIEAAIREFAPVVTMVTRTPEDRMSGFDMAWIAHRAMTADLHIQALTREVM